MSKMLFEWFEGTERKLTIMEWEDMETNIKAFVHTHPKIEHFQAYPIGGAVITWHDDIENWRILADKWWEKIERDAWNDELNSLESDRFDID